VLKKLRTKKELLIPVDKKFLKYLKKIIGYTPKNLKIYQKAFIHKSASKTDSRGKVFNNERLEYLGDAVLDAIIADYLFLKFLNKDEGFLTQTRSKIVNRDHLNLLSQRLGIHHLVVSNTAKGQHKYLYGDALEALIGAIYLDKGYEKTKKIVKKRILEEHIDLTKIIKLETDFKSRIIEWGQKNKTNINFETQEETDEQTNETLFVSHVFIASDVKGRGVGNSKKEAEQNAAKQAIKTFSS
jgi:ribonuclease-3